MVKPYTLDDVVAALNQVRLTTGKDSCRRASISGAACAARRHLEGRWRLVYTDTRNEFIKTGDGDRVERSTHSASGARARRHGERCHAGLARRQGRIGPGMQILAVNGLRFSAEVRATPSRIRRRHRVR